MLCGAVEPGADVVVVVVVGLDQRQRDGRHKDNEHEGRGGHSFKKIHSIYSHDGFCSPIGRSDPHLLL